MEHYLRGPGGEPPDLNLDYERHLPWDEKGNDKRADSTKSSGVEPDPTRDPSAPLR
jgi:hypothetical protein